MAEKRKAFKELLLRGVEGQYFSYKNQAIRIVDLGDGRGSGAVEYQTSDGEIHSMNFETAYRLQIATLRQTMDFRQKESKLAKKSK